MTVFNFSLLQLIHDATHSLGNILDLALANNPNKCLNISVDSTPCLSKSNHHLITFDLDSNFSPVKENFLQPVYNYSKADLIGLNNYFLYCDYGLDSSTDQSSYS